MVVLCVSGVWGWFWGTFSVFCGVGFLFLWRFWVGWGVLVVWKVWDVLWSGVWYSEDMTPQNEESTGGGGKELRFRINDETHTWLVQYSHQWGVSLSGAARMILLGGIRNGGHTQLPTPDTPLRPSPENKSWLKTEPVRGQGKPRQEPEPSGHVCDFEYQRERPGKKTNPNKLYTCDCGNQEWRHQ